MTRIRNWVLMRANPGGLGIFIVKKTMDEIDYEYKDGKKYPYHSKSISTIKFQFSSQRILWKVRQKPVCFLLQFHCFFFAGVLLFIANKKYIDQSKHHP